MSESVINAVSVSVDAGYDDLRYRFHTLAVLVVNGTTWQPPFTSGVISRDKPSSDVASECALLDAAHLP